MSWHDGKNGMTQTGIQETETWRVVGADGEETTAILDRAATPLGFVYVMAHGAGGNMEHVTISAFAREFAAAGIDVVRFNFYYTHRGKRAPDRMPRLMACYRSIIDHVRSSVQPQRLLIGGQSMGGRTASMLAAAGQACEGLILLAYPLHPAGKPERLRDAHLPGISLPTLCLNGTRDNLCRRDLMDEVVGRLPDTFTMHWLEDADHGYRVPKRSGRTQQQVFEEIARTCRHWAEQLGTSLGH